MPAFDMGKGLEANVASELRISYGDAYWDLHERLGRSAEHALEVG